MFVSLFAVIFVGATLNCISYTLSREIITDRRVLQQNSLLRKYKNAGEIAARRQVQA